MDRANRNLETANRIARTIYDAVQRLRTMPYRGRNGRLENTRELVVARLPYIVVYPVFEERLVILNILHGAQAMAVSSEGLYLAPHGPRPR